MDSTDSIVKCIQKTIAELGLPKLSRDKIQNIIGLGLKEAVLGLYPDADETLISDMSRVYRKYFFNTRQDRSLLFPEVQNVLDVLKDNGFMLAVATGKSRLGLDKVLHETRLANYFTATRAADETASKPDPMMLNEIIEETKTPASAALMVGDTEFDLEMAANANIDAVAVAGGAHSDEQLSRLNPSHHIQSIGKLPSVLGL